MKHFQGTSAQVQTWRQKMSLPLNNTAPQKAQEKSVHQLDRNTHTQCVNNIEGFTPGTACRVNVRPSRGPSDHVGYVSSHGVHGNVPGAAHSPEEHIFWMRNVVKEKPQSCCCLVAGVLDDERITQMINLSRVRRVTAAMNEVWWLVVRL